MAKSANQKLKLLYLMRYLQTASDESHPLTVKDMIAELARYDISAERKSIYDDMEALRQFGLDVIQVKGPEGGYFIGSRDFELPELKLLVDSVQSSKFITEKKTLSLIKKLESLTSVHDARLLQRQVFVRGRVKSMNESVFYIVDDISAAITRDKAIRFRYYEYTVRKERRFRRNGEYYVISPFSLIWDNENYYMLGWDSDACAFKHFRVDKMMDLVLTEEARSGKAEFEALDMPAYSSKVFGMFRGEEQYVELRFANHLAGAVIDRFGKDVFLTQAGDEHFCVRVQVAVSPQFYGWLFGFGDEVEVLSPQSVRQELSALAQRLADMYQ